MMMNLLLHPRKLELGKFGVLIKSKLSCKFMCYNSFFVTNVALSFTCFNYFHTESKKPHREMESQFMSILLLNILLKGY